MIQTMLITGEYGGAFSKIEDVPDDRIIVEVPYTDSFIMPFWNGIAWAEKLTAAEIFEKQQKEALKNESERYLKRSKDGQESYAKISAEFRLAKLSGQITEELHSAIEKKLIPVRNEILAGQWKSALIELESLGSAEIGIDLYNRLHLFISNYINESYI